MSRLLVAMALGVGVGVTACVYANGYDPARYADTAPIASVDPEVEALPPTPKRRMRDPRMAEAPSRSEPLEAASPAPELDAGTPAVSPAAATADAPDAGCGTKRDPCPLQRYMHGSAATAHTPSTLTTAFTQIAGMSPDPTWAWTAIATRGADRANAGELAAAKAQCVACHATYRELYRAKFRARPL
jgi:hypothetical protein